MPFDRDDTLKKAEKLLRQGRLDAAIADYERVVEDQPGDWATTNTLGDLYVRAGQNDKAAAQFGRIAEHFMGEGFYPKAAALYKKLLKLKPQDEAAQLHLAEISQKQGLLADAKAYLNAVAVRRRSRGDKAGAASVVVRLGSVDPADFDARTAAARTLVEMGDDEGAAARFRSIYDDLIEKDRTVEAFAALREAVALNPYDQQGRVLLAKAAVAAGDLQTARSHLDRETAGNDPVLLAALLEIDLKAGDFDRAKELLPALIELGRDERPRLLDLAWALVDTTPDASYVIVDAVVEAAAAARQYEDAATMLQEFVARVPSHVPPLLKLIEICVDGELEATMYDAQAQLADAYLAAGQATEARVIAEDLVAREPWERVHIERFRRALVMLKVSEPDSLIAERLSGQVPFMATDIFGENADARAAEQAAAQAAADAPIEERAAATETAAAPESEPADGSKLQEAFNEFRTEVTRQSGADQSAQHMTLARTYVQMGMPDQAIESLKTASRVPHFRFEAASLLGRIYRDRGEAAQAIEWFERAAEAPAPSVDEGRALLYDLGILVEESGETARALAIFLELQSEAGEYRDVDERVERLARVETGG